MTVKQRLLYNPEYWTNLTTFFLEPIWDEYFERVPIVAGQTYSTAEYTVYANFLTANQWIKPYQEQGFNIVIDHLWDTWVEDEFVSTDQTLVLRNVNWSWYNESLWYTALGYSTYQPNRRPDKSFLMLMNLPRPHRDSIFEQLKDYLNQAIYSYHGQGIELQNGQDMSKNETTWQRYSNPDWYDHTHFSVVVESSLQNNPMAHSEKSYKPMAFYHPTITWGPAGLLEYLKTQGFETFAHRIDESYDQEQDHVQRLNQVCASVVELIDQLDRDPGYLTDAQTQQIIKHNHNHFYNQDLIRQRFKQEIIDPIKEFAQ